MFNYVRLLKIILTNGRKFEEFKVVALNEECSALLQNKVPLNEKDLDSFTIPISTKGNKFIFSSDFIILDYEANHDVPIILERPFLKTERTMYMSTRE